MLSKPNYSATQYKNWFLVLCIMHMTSQRWQHRLNLPS